MGFIEKLVIPIHEQVLTEGRFTVAIVRFLQDLIKSVRSRVRYQGAWSADYTYHANDMVTYNGGLYITTERTTTTPGVGTEWESLSTT